MSDYTSSVLQRFQHTSTKPSYDPYKQICTYNQIRQLAIQPDISPPLSRQHKTKIQQIIGCLLYYARALGNTMLVALNIIAQSQSNPIQHTANLYNHLLDYCATYPNVGLRFDKNDMILNIHSDASYLVAPYAKSRINGYFFLSSNPTIKTSHNAPIECKILHHQQNIKLQQSSIMHKKQFK